VRHASQTRGMPVALRRCRSSEDTMAHRILIVDDEGNHRRSLSISLRMEGYEVVEAADGQHALDALKREPVDVVIADLMMPRVDGLELARRLRFAYPRTRMILMSAYHLTRAQIERAQVGDIGFLPKPYQFEQLKEQLDQAFGASSSASASGLAVAL
jgi:DNA-binding NtrC family response regulator